MSCILQCALVSQLWQHWVLFVLFSNSNSNLLVIQILIIIGYGNCIFFFFICDLTCDRSHSPTIHCGDRLHSIDYSTQALSLLLLGTALTSPYSNEIEVRKSVNNSVAVDGRRTMQCCIEIDISCSRLLQVLQGTGAY